MSGWVDQGKQRAEFLDSQKRYGHDIEAWLSEHFPDLCDPVHGPHPAAVVTVIHLHHEHGRGSLRPREHGKEIRAAVKAFNDKWIGDGDE